MGSRRRKGDGCTVVECYTPRRVVARWFSGLRSSKEQRVTREDQDEHIEGYSLSPIRCSTKRLNQNISETSKLESQSKDEHIEGYSLAPIRCSTKRLNQNIAETSKFVSQSKEAPLEMGIGSFLLYLVVASKTELDKMTNLRMQMEMLLLNVKEELQKKESQENPPLSSNDALAHNANELTECEDISNLASSIFNESSTSVLQEENTECEVSKPDPNSKLQAEVESLPLDDNQKHQISRQHKLKDNEVIKYHIPEMVVKDERYGVCPYELEKKLHELQETRQQEELLKLETALSRVERRLQEKETEVSWWKDAARLLAQHVPESSRDGLEWYNPKYSKTSSEMSVPRSFETCSKHRKSVSR